MSTELLETCRGYYKRNCVKLVTYQNYTKTHGQKNIKFLVSVFDAVRALLKDAIHAHLR